MGSSRFWLKVADEETKSILPEFPRSHRLKATGQCVMERYLSATMGNTRAASGETLSSGFLPQKMARDLNFWI